ncbi:RraA-like protein [Clavulina sp. PMI_390]|nr:RraA-like protein [Clavulina sp. PMI_390]
MGANQSYSTERADLLAPYSTCEISDAMVKLGVASGGHIPDITMFSPSRDSATEKICGPACTVQMVDAKDKTSPTPQYHFVDVAPRNSVMVISTPREGKSAVWGGLMAAGAQNRGVLGAIIDGRCRDLAELRSIGLPVFARGQSTLGQGTFTRPSRLNVPITIKPIANDEQTLFPAVTVKPEDIIVADLDGVVCIPRDMAAEVAKRCQRSKEIDDKCMADIRAGKGIKETFAKWR